LDERKSTTGFVFYIGDTAFTWTSKKQAIVTLSSCEAEYVAANSAVCHAIWLRNVLKHLGLSQEVPTEIYVDNRSAIALAKNPTHHERSKHIDTRFHFIREHVKAKEVELVSCRTYDQAADIFTKPLKHEAFIKMKIMLGMKNHPESSLRGDVENVSLKWAAAHVFNVQPPSTPTAGFHTFHTYRRLSHLPHLPPPFTH